MPTYISADGLKKMEEEYDHRKKVTRREIASQIEAAKELGDLSENFEYHDAKERQALNETKIIELEGMLKDAVVVEQQSGGDEITLGTHFVVEVNGDEKPFEMVGSQEADPLSGKISNESPIGQALMGTKVGETVAVTLPAGEVQYTVKKIL